MANRIKPQVLKDSEKAVQITAKDEVINRFKNHCNIHRLKLRDVFETAMTEFLDRDEVARLATKKLATSVPVKPSAKLVDTKAEQVRIRTFEKYRQNGDIVFYAMPQDAIDKFKREYAEWIATSNDGQ